MNRYNNLIKGRFVQAVKARIARVRAEASMRINRVEIFGPIASVRFKNYESATADDRSSARQREFPPPA